MNSLDALNRRVAALMERRPPPGRPPALIVSDPLVDARIDGFDEVFPDADAALAWLNGRYGEPSRPDIILTFVDPPERPQSAEFAPGTANPTLPLPTAETAKNANFDALSAIPEPGAKPDHPELRPGIYFYEIL